MTVDAESGVVAVLEEARRLGFLGQRPVREVIEHARGFVRALDAGHPPRSVLDLGSGGGIPGLVIALDLPDTRVTLLDRRAKRTDALERAVRRLGWEQRVSVVCQDVRSFQPDAPFDAVVARGFGPPDVTLSTAARLVHPRGLIVISEPPGARRWDDRLLERLGLAMLPATGHGAAGGLRTPAGVDRPAASPLEPVMAVFVKS